MQAKSDAYKEYGEAAILEMLVKVLPEVARELATPMGNIDKLTVVSTDGASAIPKALASNLTQVTEMVRNLTGFDLTTMAQEATSAPKPRTTDLNGVLE